MFFRVCLSFFFIVSFSVQVTAATTQFVERSIAKTNVILLPIQVSPNLLVEMEIIEAALVNALVNKFNVFSGEPVAKIIDRENLSDACTAESCAFALAEEFNSEFIVNASFRQVKGDVIFSLEVENVVEDKIEASLFETCVACDLQKLLPFIQQKTTGIQIIQDAQFAAVAAPQPAQPNREVVDFKKKEDDGGIGFGTIGSVLAGLAALGGGGGGGGSSGADLPPTTPSPSPDPDPEPTQEVSGRAVKGPLRDAIAFLDYNNNGIIDADEPSATTGSDGSYSFTVTNADGPIVVLTDGNTVDTSSGEVVSNLVLKAPAGSTVVTPLTTLLESSNLTEAELKDALDIDQSVDLKSTDPFAATTDSTLATELEKAALKVVSLTRSITAITTSDDNVNSNDLSEIAFEAIGETIKEKLETSSSFDFSDDTNIASIKVRAEGKIEDTDLNISNAGEKLVEALEESKAVIDQVDAISSIEDEGVQDIFRAVTDVNRSVKLLITADADGDGLKDFDDPDSDNDGVPNAIDAFPRDSSESEDRDGDGVGANSDADDRDNSLFLKVGTNPVETLKGTDDDGFVRLLVHQVGTRVNIEVVVNYNVVRAENDDATGISNYSITIAENWSRIRKAGTEVGWEPNASFGVQSDTGVFVSDESLELKGRFSSFSGLARNITSGNISLGVLTFETDEEASGLELGVTDDLTFVETSGFDGVKIYSIELDTDGDGFADTIDLFPNDPSENSDLDGDGIGDNADTDRDGDGVINSVDVFPNNPNESADLDGDGIGDVADPDRDGDGVSNAIDAFPNNPSESSDLDLDGIGDNSDNDRDGDGIANINDPDPDNASASRDLDGDGIADADDLDRDGDGVLNEDDAFPDDPSKTADADGDGIADNLDNDRDGDGYADGLDAFPDDPDEHRDSDLDGIGDNQDPVAAAPFERISSLSGNVATIKRADFDTSRFPLNFPVSRTEGDGLGGINIDTARTINNATNLDIDIRTFPSSGDYNLVSIKGYNYASAPDPRYAVAADSYTGAQFTNGSVLNLEDVTGFNGQGNIRFSLFRDDNELPFILMNNLNPADDDNITKYSFFGLIGQSFDDVSVFHDGIKTPKNSLPNSRAALFRGKSVGKFVDSARAEASLVTFSDVVFAMDWANEAAVLVSENTYAGNFRDTGSYDSFEPEWNQSRQRAPALDFAASLEFIESDEYYFTYAGGTDTHAFYDPESVFYSGASSSIWAAFYGEAAEDIAGSADISQVASDGTGYRYTLAFGSTFGSFYGDATSYVDADGDNYFEITSVDEAFANFDQTGGKTEFMYRPTDTNYLQDASYHERHTMGRLDWRSGEMLPVDSQFGNFAGYGDYVFKFDVNPSNGLLRMLELETDLGEPFALFSSTDSYFATGLNDTILAPFTNNDDFIVFWSDNQNNVTGGPSYGGFLRGQSLVVNNFTDYDSEITPDHFIFGLYSEATTSTVDQSADLFSEAIYCCEVSSYDDRLNAYASGIYGTFSGKSLGRYYDIGDDGVPMIDFTTSDILLEFTGSSGTIVSGNTILLDGPVVDQRVEGLDFFGDIRINSALDGRLTVNNSTVEFSGSSKMNSERLANTFWGGHFFGPDLDEIGMAWSITELIDTAGAAAGSNIKRAYLGSFGATRRASKVLDTDGDGVVDFDDTFDSDGDGIPDIFDFEFSQISEILKLPNVEFSTRDFGSRRAYFVRNTFSGGQIGDVDPYYGNSVELDIVNASVAGALNNPKSIDFELWYGNPNEDDVGRVDNFSFELAKLDGMEIDPNGFTDAGILDFNYEPASGQFAFFDNELHPGFILINSFAGSETDSITNYSFFGLAGNTWDNVSTFHDGIRSAGQSGLPSYGVANFTGQSIGHFIDENEVGYRLTTSVIDLGVDFTNLSGVLKSSSTYDSAQLQRNDDKADLESKFRGDFSELDFTASFSIIPKAACCQIYFEGIDTVEMANSGVRLDSYDNSYISGAFYGSYDNPDAAGSVSIDKGIDGASGKRYILSFGTKKTDDIISSYTSNFVEGVFSVGSRENALNYRRLSGTNNNSSREFYVSATASGDINSISYTDGSGLNSANSFSFFEAKSSLDASTEPASLSPDYRFVDVNQNTQAVLSKYQDDQGAQLFIATLDPNHYSNIVFGTYRNSPIEISSYLDGYDYENEAFFLAREGINQLPPTGSYEFNGHAIGFITDLGSNLRDETLASVSLTFDNRDGVVANFTHNRPLVLDGDNPEAGWNVSADADLSFSVDMGEIANNEFRNISGNAEQYLRVNGYFVGNEGQEFGGTIEKELTEGSARRYFAAFGTKR